MFNATLTYSTRLSNGASFVSIQTIFYNETQIEFKEEGVVLEMKSNSVKYSYRIEGWPFKKVDHRLELCISQNLSSDVACSKSHLTQGGGVLETTGYLDEKNFPEITQNILTFSINDGKSVDIEVEGSKLGEVTKILIPSFKETMFYDPDLSLFLGVGSDSKNPCQKNDYLWTWIILSFLLFWFVFMIVVILAERYNKSFSRLIRGKESFAINKFRKKLESDNNTRLNDSKKKLKS